MSSLSIVNVLLFQFIHRLEAGGPSSPLMFMMFINDIVQNMHDNFDEILTVNELRLFIFLYADDADIFAKSPKVLQSLLHHLEVYCLT